MKPCFLLAAIGVLFQVGAVFASADKEPMTVTWKATLPDGCQLRSSHVSKVGFDTWMLEVNCYNQEYQTYLAYCSGDKVRAVYPTQIEFESGSQSKALQLKCD